MRMPSFKIVQNMESIRYDNTVSPNYFWIKKETNTISETTRPCTKKVFFNIHEKISSLGCKLNLAIYSVICSSTISIALIHPVFATLT